MDRRAIGQSAEDIAARFLAERGATVLLRNYRRRLGELDVVAVLDDLLLIIEVRTRASNQYGGAAASVDFRKQRRIIRASQQLLQEHRELAMMRARFDVVVITGVAGSQPVVEWIPNAFTV
jgi:putative endonuclease